MRRMYRNEHLIKIQEQARETVSDLFEAYMSEPARLPDHVARREELDGRARMVCDYISGMTDRFALDLRGRLSLRDGDGPSGTGVIKASRGRGGPPS